MIEVRTVRSGDEGAWDLIANSSDDAWLTHTWAWNREIEERILRGERRSLVILRDGRLIGIVPQHLHTTRRGPLVRRILYANYFAGGGVALANDVEGADRAACVAAATSATHAQARRDGVDKLMLFLPPLARRNLRGDPEARRALGGSGLVDRSSTALVIRLAGRTKEEISAAMKKAARNKVRKAEHAGVHVTLSSAPDTFERLYALHAETSTRGGTNPSPPEYIEGTLRTGRVHVFFAELDGKTIGAVAIALFDRRALFDVSASREEGLRLGVINLLKWRALEWLIDAGAEACEVGVVPPPGQPVPPKLATIADHQRSLGADEVPAFSGEFVYRPRREAVVALAQRMHAKARRAPPAP